MQRDSLATPALRIWGSEVRIFSGAPLRYKTGHSKHCRFCAGRSDERPQQRAFRPHDANFLRVHLDALGERAEVVATVAAALGPHALAGGPAKSFQSLGCEKDRPRSIQRILGPLCVKAGLDQLRAFLEDYPNTDHPNGASG